MENEFDYYLLLAANEHSIPSIIQNSDSDLDLDLEEGHLDEIDLIEFEFDEPYPKKPKMADYLDGGGIGVISEKIIDIVKPLNIYQVQLVPAVISNPRNNEIYNYYYLHIYNYINCLDKNKSVFEGDEELETVNIIEKMVLDTTVLAKIPLEERLIFRLGELYTHQLFHKSIVDKIMESKPSGIRFVKVEDYHIGSAFD
jgi:hypothetical protein